MHGKIWNSGHLTMSYPSTAFFRLATTLWYPPWI